ncbi:hypothetical protein C8T65DRAFT_144737 [Cerioporus squamosus]|nr:hypothetical protein C8T65DRAFT_144737 [Cerioporus squamosus]
MIAENTVLNATPSRDPVRPYVLRGNAPSHQPEQSSLTTERDAAMPADDSSLPTSMTEQTPATHAIHAAAAADPSSLETVRTEPSPAALNDRVADDTISLQDLQQMVDNCVARAVAFSLVEFREEMQRHIDIQIAYLDGLVCGLGQRQRQMSGDIASQSDQCGDNLESLRRDIDVKIARLEAMLARVQRAVVQGIVPQPYLLPSASAIRPSASTTVHLPASTVSASTSIVHPSVHEGTRTPPLEHGPALPLMDRHEDIGSSRFPGAMSP